MHGNLRVAMRRDENGTSNVYYSLTFTQWAQSATISPPPPPPPAPSSTAAATTYPKAATSLRGRPLVNGNQSNRLSVYGSAGRCGDWAVLLSSEMV